MKYVPELHKLSNGVTVILDSFESPTTAVEIRFITGSRDEQPNQYGLTHFCEHMLCKGTRRFPSARAINDFVADNSGERNAYTSDKYIALHGRCVSDTVSALIDVLCDMLQHSKFDDAVIEKERGVILNELNRKQNDTDSVVFNQISKQLLGLSDYVYRTLGSAENIKSFSRQQMKMWLARRLSATNCIVCVSGGINNPSDVLKDLEQKLSFLKPFDVPTRTDAFEYSPGAVTKVIPEKGMTTIDVVVPNFVPDTLDNLKKRTCQSLLCDFIQQELFRVLRTERGLVYGVSHRKTEISEIDAYVFSTTVPPEQVEAVVTLMAKTMRDVYDGVTPITDNFLKRNYARGRLGNADWMSDPVKRRNTLLKCWINRGALYDFYAADKMKASITPDDVMRMTRGMFDAHVSFVTTGAPHNVNLRDVWNKNFSPVPASLIIEKLKGDYKCH